MVQNENVWSHYVVVNIIVKVTSIEEKTTREDKSLYQISDASWAC